MEQIIENKQINYRITKIDKCRDSAECLYAKFPANQVCVMSSSSF